MLRKWYRLDSRWLIRPHQQHGTEGVINYEAGGRTKALRAEARAVTVARSDQEVDVFSYCENNFPLDSSPFVE